MRLLYLACVLILASTGAWMIVLGQGHAPRSPTAVVLMALSLWIAATASVAGMLVARSRWARRLALGLTGAHGVVALLFPVDRWWGLAAVLTAGTAIVVGGPLLDGQIRPRPPAAGPPTRAVLIPLTLIAVPFALGAFGGDGWAVVAGALSSLVAAYWFIRTLPAALAVVRLLWPLTSLALGWPMGRPVGLVAAVAAVTVAALAWHPTVATAVRPLTGKGSPVPIPPELAPSDVLDAADIDDRGRPR